jgi:hypothetical protein
MCLLKPAILKTTTVSLIQTVAKAADLPTRALTEAVLPWYARPNTVMAVWPVCGAVFGPIRLTETTEVQAAEAVLPIDGLYVPAGQEVQAACP